MLHKDLYKDYYHELTHLVGVASTIERIYKLPTLGPLIIREAYYTANNCIAGGESDEVRSQLYLTTARMLAFVSTFKQNTGLTIECPAGALSVTQIYHHTWRYELFETDHYWLSDLYFFGLFDEMLRYFSQERSILEGIHSVKITTLLLNTLLHPKIKVLLPFGASYTPTMPQKSATISSTYAFRDVTGKMYPND